MTHLVTYSFPFLAGEPHKLRPMANSPHVPVIDDLRDAREPWAESIERHEVRVTIAACIAVRQAAAGEMERE